MNDKEFFIDHDGRKIHCKLDFPANMNEDGKCPLFILVHGFTGWMDEDHIVAIANAANEIGIAVLRTDMYGHGKSDGKFFNHTILKWVDQMTAIMDYACELPFVSKLFLGGHSQGGLLAMLAGAIEQDRLDAILPLSPASIIPSGSRAGNLFGIQFDPINIIKRIDISTPEKERIISGNYVRAAQLFSEEWAIKQFKKPVLIIHGDADTTIPFKFSVEAAAGYENCTLKLIPGADHGYHGHLDEACKIIQQFLLKLI